MFIDRSIQPIEAASNRTVPTTPLAAQRERTPASKWTKNSDASPFVLISTIGLFVASCLLVLGTVAQTLVYGS
jgi:hypothetical protein